MIGLVLAAAAVNAVAGQVSPNAVAGQLEVIPAATVEFQAGEAPLVYGQAPVPMLMEIITPGVGISYHSRRLELLAGYGLRLFWQQARGVDPAASPLLLHQVNLTLAGHLTERLELKLTGIAYEGQTDYTYISSSILGPNQVVFTVPPKILSGNLTGEANLHLTPLATAGIAFQAVHNQPLGESAATTGFLLPYFTSFAATPGVTVRVSRTDDASSAVAVQYQRVSDLSLTDVNGIVHTGSVVSAIIVSPTLQFHRLLSPHSEFTLKGGVSVTHLDSDVEGTSDSVSPTGSAAIAIRLLNTRRAILQAKLSQSFDYYLDPVLGTAADHAYTTADIYLGLPKNWTIAFEASFITPLEPHPQRQPPLVAGGPPTLVYFDEVAAAAQLAGRHLLSNDLLLEFGVRWADRRPAFGVPAVDDTGFHQRQLFLYGMLSGTTHPAWMPQREVASIQ